MFARVLRGMPDACDSFSWVRPESRNARRTILVASTLIGSEACSLCPTGASYSNLNRSASRSCILSYTELVSRPVSYLEQRGERVHQAAVGAVNAEIARQGVTVSEVAKAAA